MTRLRLIPLTREDLEAVPLAAPTTAALAAHKRAHDDPAVTEEEFEARWRAWQPYLHELPDLERLRWTWELWKHCFGGDDLEAVWRAWMDAVNDANLEGLVP